MPYVSAIYGPPSHLPMPEGSPRGVLATDEQGVVYSLAEDSQVGDWLDYLAAGGTIDQAIIPPIVPEQVDLERDRRIDAGFIFDGVRYQSRAFDRDNISGATQAANMAITNGAQEGDLHWQSPDYEFVWIAEDNTLTPMDAQTVVRMGQTLMDHKQSLIFAARSLKDTDPIPMDYADNKYWPI